jgi:alkanesulfonate monooxygenase SsuD/methylene tetrahydromethanopterin reductase-like flavin-dependent oxidoreductase (luciferase family)
VKFGLDVATTGEWSEPLLLVELAVDAEAAGWDGFFLWDIMLTDDDAPVAEPWTTLAAIAARTQRIRIGAMVTPLVRRLPWEVARHSVSVDQLSRGRLIFAAGLGFSVRELERLGTNADLRSRAELMEQSLDMVDRLWRGESVTDSGPGFDVHDVRTMPVPVQQPRIPVWLAAGWPRLRPLRRAARWDGVYLMTNNQATDARLRADEVAEAIEFIRGERGHLDGFDVAANVGTSADADGGAAANREMAEAGATWTLELTPDTLAEHRALIRRGPGT